MIRHEKTLHPDGSRSEIIIETETGRAEILIYDADGNCRRRIYGFFSDGPEPEDTGKTS